MTAALTYAFAGLLAVQAATTPAKPTPRESSTRELFAAMAGDWSCGGSFADGRALASDISFTPRNDGRSLAYHHADRPPNNFVQDALWGPDVPNDAVVSLALAGNQTILGPQLFVARDWSASHIVFVAQALTSPPFRPNRFTYTLADQKTLNVLWEVERDGRFSVGDRLTCARSAAIATEARSNRSEPAPGRVEAAAASGSLDDLRFMQGKWVGEGTSEAGRGAGYFTFERDLQGKTWVRRNHAEYPQPGKATVIHEDVMIVYEDAATHALRAFYTDSERNTIQYGVTIAGDRTRVTFVSEADGRQSRFRLTYVRLDDDRMTVGLEMAPPDHPDQFRKIVDGIVRRTS